MDLPYRTKKLVYKILNLGLCKLNPKYSMISDDRRGGQDTLIQERVVQIIMEGKDLFARGWDDATAKQVV